MAGLVKTPDLELLSAWAMMLVMQLAMLLKVLWELYLTLTSAGLEYPQHTGCFAESEARACPKLASRVWIQQVLLCSMVWQWQCYCCR